MSSKGQQIRIRMNAESRLIAQLKSHVMRCREYRHRQNGKTTR